MVAGAHKNLHRHNRLDQVTTKDNLANPDHEQAKDCEYKAGKEQLMNAITNVPNLTQRTTQKHKLLRTRALTFKGQKKCYKVFEHLLLNHIRPFQNNISENEKLHISTSLLREKAIESRQFIKVTPDKTVPQLLQTNNSKKSMANVFNKTRRPQTFVCGLGKLELARTHLNSTESDKKPLRRHNTHKPN